MTEKQRKKLEEEIEEALGPVIERARKNGTLGDRSQIVLKEIRLPADVMVELLPPEKTVEKILAMRPQDYFTAEQLESAGVAVTINLEKIRGRLWRHADEAIPTMNSVVMLGRDGLKRRQCGEQTVAMMAKVLRHDGIYLPL